MRPIRRRPVRMAGRFLAHRLRSLHPFEVQALVQNACDLRCVYCRCPEIRTRPMSTEQWTRAIARFGELGCLRIKFQGGEPTLRKDLPVLCDAAREAGIVAAVVTNGQRIAEEPSLLDHLEECVVSIDACDPDVHDVLRGAGTHARAVRAVELAVARGIATFVVMVVNRRNQHELEPMLSFCEARGVSLHAQPVTFGLHYTDDEARHLALTDDEARTLNRRLSEWKRAGRPLLFSVGAYARAADWPARYGQLTEPRKGRARCMAGRFYVHVEANGDVWPCQQHGDRAFRPGNLVRDGIDESLRRAADHECGDCWSVYLLERKRLFGGEPKALWETARRNGAELRRAWQDSRSSS